MGPGWFSDSVKRNETAERNPSEEKRDRRRFVSFRCGCGALEQVKADSKRRGFRARGGWVSPMQ